MKYDMSEFDLPRVPRAPKKRIIMTRTHRKILALLTHKPQSNSEIAAKFNVTSVRAGVILKDLCDLELADRNRSSITSEFVYRRAEGK